MELLQSKISAINSNPTKKISSKVNFRKEGVTISAGVVVMCVWGGGEGEGLLLKRYAICNLPKNANRTFLNA
jgi:hypothetical protein